MTALIATKALNVTYGFAVHPSRMFRPDLIGVALVSARWSCFASSCQARSDLRPPVGIDPRFRRTLAIMTYIVIAIIPRVLLRTAFRWPK